MSIPHLFRCPISLDLFTDPVTLSTGQTYDRPSIERWLADGNSTCPVTMQRLRDTSLVPNRTLRHLIDRWLLSVPEPKHQPPAAAPGTGTAASLATLKPILSSSETGDGTKLEILKKIRILATESDIGKACLVNLGYFPLLLQLLFRSPIPHQEFVELGLDCVLSLSHSSTPQLDSLNMLKNEASLASFLQLLDQGNVRINSSLCCLLETIAAASVTRELCLILGQLRHVLKVVVGLLHDRSESGAPESAVRAISGICSVDGNRGNAVREGAIDGLVSYLMSSDMKNCSLALATLEALVGLEAGRKSLIKNPNAVRVLVKSVFRVSSSSMSSDNEGSEHAVGALLTVCCESAKARAEAVDAGVLTQVLLLLQSQCGCKAKAKARALLKLHRSVWARGSPAAGASLYHVM